MTGASERWSRRPAHADLTEHALARISERFNMAPNVLVDALDKQLAKRLGVSSDTRMAHFLIWSQEDNAHAVAIQNVVTGQVVTVLTLEMYARTYPTRIRGGVLQKTINRMVYAGVAPPDVWRHMDCSSERVTVYARQFSTRRDLYLGKWRGPVKSPQLAHLGTSRDFAAWVARRLHERRANFDDVLSIVARFPGGDLQDVPIKPD